MRLRRKFGRAGAVGAVPLALLLVTGCTSDSQGASQEAAPTPEAASPTSSIGPGPTGEATGSPEPTEQVEIEVADPQALSEVEASMQALNAERESLDPNDYLNEANDLTARAAAAYGTEGLGAFACQMTVGIVSGAQGAQASAVRTGLGNTLKVIVRNATGELDQTLAGAGLDQQMQKLCPDVRTAALEASGVQTLDAL